ncbi:MAG: aldehyde dehydrogenase [Bacteroidetes bacterium]|nr:aldehyde dehydrogenase [Bacteroidota bacterium]MBS1633544.1 aldehyde dehydrogenase [Bacteroidota bacterium]
MLLEPLNYMRRYYESGATQSFSFRKEQLKKLKQAIVKYEKELYAALYSDLKKSPEECWVTELGMVTAEINAALKSLHRWMKPQKAGTNLLNFPSSSYVMNEPMGVALIIGPWNYPFQLLINPLVGAIAAGNCVVLKASEFAPATDSVMKKMIEEIFPKEYILYMQGEGALIVPQLMNYFRFDFVFYTGSTAVGKIVYKMAAEHLVPVTLELGGKSPCVVEVDANIKVAARRIAMTKFSNAGQMCVAPDYVLVQQSVKEKFIESLRGALLSFFSNKPEEDYNYCRIINEKQFDRLTGYLNSGKIVHGGRTDRGKLFIEPTILENVSLDTQVMKDEVFGPILPVITFETMDEAKQIIQQNPNPLAFYVYTSSRKRGIEWLNAIPSGGACINNSSWHLTNHHLPFGGRGFSGMGNYHGKYSFDTFSHKKAVMKTPTWFDPNLKYPPFKGMLKWYKKIIR